MQIAVLTNVVKIAIITIMNTPENEPKSLGEIFEEHSLEDILGAPPNLERQQHVKEASVRAEVQELSDRRDEIIAEIQSGNDSPELRDLLASTNHSLLDAQADHIAADGTTGSHQP